MYYKDIIWNLTSHAFDISEQDIHRQMNFIACVTIGTSIHISNTNNNNKNNNIMKVPGVERIMVCNKYTVQEMHKIYQ